MPKVTEGKGQRYRESVDQSEAADAGEGEDDQRERVATEEEEDAVGLLGGEGEGREECVRVEDAWSLLEKV